MSYDAKRIVLYFSGRVSEIRNLLYACHQGMDLVKDMERELYQLGLVSLSSASASFEDGGAPVIEIVQGDPGLVRLETTLLHLGAMNQVCEGVFYMLPIKVAPNAILVRCGEIIYPLRS